MNQIVNVRGVARSMAGVILLLLAAGPASAQTYTISPAPFLLAQNNSGAIINNACIWTYTAGTTTAATTYADAAGTPNSNPIRSDSAGRFTAFLTPGQSYKYVYESACTPPAHGTVLRTADNISAMPASGVSLDVTGTAGETIASGAVAYQSDGSGGKNAGQWYNGDATTSYSSSSAPTIGIAQTAITSGTSGSFRMAGRVTGQTGLTAGTRYYVASTAGTLTGTEPANSRFVGTADSTTSLVIPIPPVTYQPLRMAEGRLTATSGTPVTTADVTAATTIYYTPYTGNRIALYDGTSRWNVRTFTEITISVTTCTASKPYDVFLYDNNGTVTAETLVWTSATARATALTTQDGVLVKTGATTRRYVGSFYCNSTGGHTDDSLTKRTLWNYYNRVPRALLRMEGTASWTYTTAAWRQANASTSNQFGVLVGVAEVPLRIDIGAAGSNTTLGASMAVAIGVGSTTVPATVKGPTLIGYTSVNNGYANTTATYLVFPPVGYQFYVWLEISNGTGTQTWYGQGGGSLTSESGMTGFIEG